MAGKHKQCKRIVLFNHKGGVGKTTITVNLAYMLAEQGKRVLLVDTDPQCSISSYFLDETFLDDLLDESESQKGRTLWTAVQAVSEGVGPVKHVPPFNIAQNLYLAAGDIRLSEFENSLSEAWNLCIGRNKRGYHCMAALSLVVDRLVEQTQADYVFYDAGPNIGPLNRCVLLDCSHFIVPAACDLFSVRAIKTLGFALNNWLSTWDQIKERAPDTATLLNGTPQLLGYIPQGFKTYRGRMTIASFDKRAELAERVEEFVNKPLAEFYGRLYQKGNALNLGEIKYFGTLANTAQELGVPLWRVPRGNAKTKADAQRDFRKLAAAVEAVK